MKRFAKHEWKSTDSDGNTLYLRCLKKRGKLQFKQKNAKHEDWLDIAKPDKNILSSFMAVLKAKYQRRRVAWEDVELVMKLIEDDKFYAKYFYAQSN